MKIKHGIGGSKRLGKRNSTGRQFKLGLLLVGAALMSQAFQQVPVIDNSTTIYNNILGPSRA